MNHKPVCVKCGLEMKPETNGVGVLDIADFGPYKIWDADKWKCPGCKYEIVTGFGREPIAVHYEEIFQRVVQDYGSRGLLFESRQR